MRLSQLYCSVMKYLMPNESYARWRGATIGSGCRIFTKNFGSEPFLIKIGNDVTLSGNVTFINHDGSGWLYRDERGRRFLFRRIEIGNSVFVGANSILMPGVRIGDRVVVGAGSVVIKSVPSGVVVAGNPARYICTYDDLMSRVSKWQSRDKFSAMSDYRDWVSAILDTEFKPLLSIPTTKMAKSETAE